MPKAIFIAIAAGAVIGTLGGLMQGEPWLSIGGGLVVGGVIVLYVFGFWKNPLGVVKAEMDVEETFSGYPPKPTVEHQLPSDEATIRTKPKVPPA